MMESLAHLSIAWTAIAYLALAFVSAVLPWVNAEVLVLSLPAVANSSGELAGLVLIVTAGQMAGKCIIYWTARRAATIGSGRPEPSSPSGSTQRPRLTRNAALIGTLVRSEQVRPALARTLDRWRERAAARPSSPVLFVALSSIVGVPPFYVMSAVAGALKVPFASYLVAGTCGRLVRFGALAILPQAVPQFV